VPDRRGRPPSRGHAKTGNSGDASAPRGKRVRTPQCRPDGDGRRHAATQRREGKSRDGQQRGRLSTERKESGRASAPTRRGRPPSRGHAETGNSGDASAPSGKRVRTPPCRPDGDGRRHAGTQRQGGPSRDGQQRGLSSTERPRLSANQTGTAAVTRARRDGRGKAETGNSGDASAPSGKRVGAPQRLPDGEGRRLAGSTARGGRQHMRSTRWEGVRPVQGMRICLFAKTRQTPSSFRSETGCSARPCVIHAGRLPPGANGPASG